MKILKNFIIALCTILLAACAQQKSSLTQKPSSDMSDFDYEKAWKQVLEFEGKGLPESALKEVNVIYHEAKKSNEAGQLAKAVIHQLKFIDFKEEDALSKNVARLREEAAQASFPVKPLLHSMLADIYWQYYENNRYRFRQRTETVTDAPEDFQTWSLDQLVKEVIQQYELSLSFKKESKATPVHVYDAVIDRGNELGRQYRPTLYDFLAHRALAFYSNSEPTITRPAELFILDDERYLSDVDTFTSLKVQTIDTLSFHFRALRLYQNLLAFHLNDSDPAALVDLELKRLQFIRSHHVGAQKNEWYLKTLQQLEVKTIKHESSTRVTYQIALLYTETAQHYKPLLGDEHKWDNSKAYALAEEGKKRFPESMGAIQCETLQRQILFKRLDATIEKNNEPEIPFRALIQYANITNLYYRVIPITRNEIVEKRRQLDRDYNIDREKEFIAFLTKRNFVKSGKFILPDDKDYQQHSIEVKIDPLPVGEFVILFSHHPEFTTSENGFAYGFTTVSNIAYVHRKMPDGATEVYALHRRTGEPLKGVTVDVMSFEYNARTSGYEAFKVASFITDQRGYVNIGLIKNESHRSFVLNFTKDKDFNSTEDITQSHYHYRYGNLSQYPEGERDGMIQTTFFLDRAIYRPGQTIYFKGLVVETDGKNPRILKKHKATITLYDVNYQERGSVEVTTNEFGTFNGTFTAPSSGLTGQMHLTTSDEGGSIAFSVEEYKRPKFEVTFEPVKGTFRLEDVVNVTGKAIAYSGAAIDGAKVQYRVVREARFPFWWWCRWGYYPSSPAVEIINGTGQTDASGNFKIQFNAIPDKSVDVSSDPTFNYTVYADVTDINGETHSSVATISVGYKALLVNVGVHAVNKDSVKNNVAFPIITRNLAGQHEPAKGTITIHALTPPVKAFRTRLWAQPDRQLYSQSEYYQLFPHDQYQDEMNKLLWPRGEQFLTTTFDTEKENVLRIPTTVKNGEYVLEIKSKDKYGNEVKEIAFFKVFQPSAPRLTVPAVHAFESIKLSAEPGEKASFATGTAENNINVLYEIEHDGKLLSKEWMVLSNQQRQFEVPIKETYRGNITVHYTFIKNNRVYKENITIYVPYTNKALDLSFESFRNKLLPGQKEEWKVIVKGRNGDKVAAEMVATLYDASLDAFVPHEWYTSFYNALYQRLNWESINDFVPRRFSAYYLDWNAQPSRYTITPDFDDLNWFGYSIHSSRYEMLRSAPAGAKKMKSMEMSEESEAAMDMAPQNAETSESLNEVVTNKPDAKNIVPKNEVQVRSNFNETAFFLPSLRTNEKGEIIISFTIPESLTRWKMMGFAHTQDLKFGHLRNEVVTQKELMVVPNPPRFFREGDKMIFSAKVTSLNDAPLNGKATLEFFDALTMKPVKVLTQANANKDFSIKAKQSTEVSWSIEIPEGLQALQYRIIAAAGNFSDGEEMVLPVVTNRMLVTETMPLSVKGGQTKTFRFEKLINTKSTTLKHQRYTLEFTANPAWYAVQSLPYLMEYPYECIEQTFSRYYANSIASHIANSNPRIKQVFDTWKNIQPNALLSNLEKNQELKSALLEETPWVLHAHDETQRKRMVGVLFDLNRMSNELDQALDKIIKAQLSNGGFSWFPGMPEDRYMTQHIIAGMGHLSMLGISSVRDDNEAWNMTTHALSYLDEQIRQDYERLKAAARRKEIDLNDNHLSYVQIHYLYARSAFRDVAVSDASREAFNYFLGQAKKYWMRNNLYLEGMLCLALHRYDEKSITKDMLKSFRERALTSEEMGMYFKYNSGYFWYEAPIETQALLIEVFEEVANDIQAVDELKIWLLKQKQTTDWRTTRATAEACYALLKKGTSLLTSTNMTEIRIDNTVIDPSKRIDSTPETGTGYFKTSWNAQEVKPSLGVVEVTKKDAGVSWGAVYWQYFEQLDKITSAETPLKLKKDLFLQTASDRGPVLKSISETTPLKVGDLVKVRLEIRVDRNLEYVHIKDMRASAFEPVSTLSTYKYQDGLYYYESPRDLATNFFIGYLPKGTYVFEYALRVSQQGDFSNGITTMQCMYAPEFSSHSAGIRVQVTK